MTALELLRTRYKELLAEVKSLANDELKMENLELYYMILAIYNKYGSKSPSEPDIDHQ